MSKNRMASESSVNRVTIEHLKIACRHVQEMMAAGMTENHAIRLLELFADVYAKLHNGGSAVPHHVSQVPYTQWSVAAKQLKRQNPNIKASGNLVVEHGTPRRQFARLIRRLFENSALTEKEMASLVKRYWKLAVVTKQEDQYLNSKFRNILFSTPKKRWAAADIEFDDSEI
ncbi:MAG: hypothetical protein ABI230_05565 [Aestuariivirga sp.]